MRIVLCCATRRGYRFLQRLHKLSPQSHLVVFSFREEPWEPPFLEDIRALTQSCGGQFFEARQIGGPTWIQFWESTPVDLMLLVSWRYLIPASVYRRPCLGTYVFHDSLLPEYRGFSPTVWAMINGEDHTGVTLFEIADEVDAGDIVDQQRVPITKDDTIDLVIDRVTETYLDLLERNLSALQKGNPRRFHQDHSRASYTRKRLPDDNRITWTDSARVIYNLIRAVGAPYPGAYTYLDGHKLRVWTARDVADERHYAGSIPGRVVEVRPGEGAVVSTGNGVLMLTKVQLEGGHIVCAAEVLEHVGQTLGP